MRHVKVDPYSLFVDLKSQTWAEFPQIKRLVKMVVAAPDRFSGGLKLVNSEGCRVRSAVA